MTITETGAGVNYAVAEVKSGALSVALKAAQASMGKDAFLPILTCAQVRFDVNELRVTSTNRFTLTDASVRNEAGALEDAGWSINLERRDVDALVKAIGARPQAYSTTTLTYASDGFHHTLTVVVNYGTTFTFRGFDGDFPRTDSLWPDTTSTPHTEASVTLDPIYLAAFAKMPREKGDHNATLTQYGSGSKPWVSEWECDTVQIRHLIMPLRRVS